MHSLKKKVIIGELMVLVSSVFIFRSLWMLIDKLFADSYLEIMFIAGLIMAVLGLILLNYETKKMLE